MMVNVVGSHMQDLLELVLVLAVTVSISTWIGAVRRRSRNRQQELRSAAVALKAHYDAVSHLVHDPAVSAEQKNALVMFTEGLSSQQVSEAFGAALLESRALSGADRPAAMDDLHRLYRTRPDLASIYQTAILSGLSAVILRWPGNANLFQRVSVEVSSDLRKERAAAKTLIDLAERQSARNQRHGFAASGDYSIAS